MSIHENHARGELIRLRRSLTRCRDEARLLRRDWLRRKYNPDQPRVPAGGTGGGRWTSGSGLAESAPAGGGGYVVDETGQEAWASFDETIGEDGLVSERDIVNRDGSTIQSEYAASREAGFDERHTVTLPNGEKTVFETTDRTQTIRDGTPDREILSRTVWTTGGPEPDATVQPAYSGGKGFGAAGAVLFGWLSPFNGVGGQQAVMGFNARDFRPGTTGTGALDLGYVGQLSDAEVERACRMWPVVKNFADRAANASGPSNQFQSMAVYGTDVHSRFKSYIDDLQNPNFKAERSFMKELADPTENEFVRYGQPGSIRVDAYEYLSDGTLCVYDLKTGRSGLSDRRAEIIGTAMLNGFRNIRRIILTEVRPSR